MVLNQVLKQDTSKLLTEDVIHILECIEERGFKARIVGGAVRNWVLCAEISDVDIATTALPEQIFEIFENVVPSGLNHGTVTLVYKGRGYEITTLRKDIETYGRKAKVNFCQSFEIDSNRRDFTINAIYMDRYGKIYDYHNGIDDISQKIIRFIGDPRTRIQEDFLRILRYFRFVAYYGDFKCSKEVLEVIYSLRKNIVQLSSERILAEVLKIFVLDGAYKIMPPMKPLMGELFGVSSSEEILTFVNEKLEKNEDDEKLSAKEKLCLVLKFSKRSFGELIRKYKFPKQMKRLLKLEIDETLREDDIGTAKRYLKEIYKTDYLFWSTYWVVKRWMLQKQKSDVSETIINETLLGYKKLREFCKSKGAEFQFRASLLSKYELSPAKLGKVMKEVRGVWLKTEKELGEKELLEIAKKKILALEETAKEIV